MDYLNIGSAPYGEDCAQLGTPGYFERAMKECNAFKNQLERTFGVSEHAYLKVKGFSHDFGTYYETICVYSNDEGEAYAFMLEAGAPEYWDEQAKKEISQ